MVIRVVAMLFGVLLVLGFTTAPATAQASLGLVSAQLEGRGVAVAITVTYSCDPDDGDLTWLKLVSTGGVLDSGDDRSGLVVEGCAGVQNVAAGLDGDAAVGP